MGLREHRPERWGGRALQMWLRRCEGLSRVLLKDVEMLFLGNRVFADG